MTNVPLGRQAYSRTYAQEPEIQLLNRFFESNPTNQVEQVALLARPGSTYFGGAGIGPIRRFAHQSGIFDGDLFFVSGDQLYRWDGLTTPVAISGTLSGTGNPQMTFVAGAGYEHMFIADGLTLQYYDGEAAASDILTLAGSITATETVTIDGIYYEFTAGSVDAGAPAGTVGSPWLIDMGLNDEEALLNLLNAIDVGGVAGTDYSTATTINTNVSGFASSATTLTVKARVRGTGGNSINVAETGAALTWATATLAGGGSQALNGVVTPDGVGVVSVDNLASFVLCVVSNSQRFYWIRPGAVTIDALDFAEAESEPDEIIQVIVVGDTAWFFGDTSSEPWYATGDTDITASQFAPQRGLAFSQGALEGTAIPIRTQIYVVAEDHIVYEVSGGMKPVSNNGISERIRLGQAALT